MDTRFENIKVCAISAAVPSNTIDNLQSATDENRKQISKLIRVTGIKRRHSIENTGILLVDLAISAALNSIKTSGVDKEKIRLILYMTQEPEFYGPSTAFYVQKELGVGTNCMVADINLGCSGFVAGMQIAASILSQITDDECYALLINAEKQTYQKRSNENDKILFGDAATATILKKGDNCGCFIGTYFSDGNRYRTIFRAEKNDCVEMDGDAVFQFTINEVANTLSEFIKKNKLDNKNIDFCVLHQAQKFIIDHLAKRCSLEKEKILYSLDEFGNTSGASIPLTICRNRDKLNTNNNILASGFGVGLAWGVLYFQLTSESISKIIEL